MDLTGSDPTNPTPEPVVVPAYSRRRIARNIVGLTGIAIAGKFIGLLINIYARRVIEVKTIGMIGWNIAVLAYLELLTNPGMLTIAKRDVARNPAEATRLTSLRITAQLLLAIGAFAVAAAIALSGIRGPMVGKLLLIQGVGLVATVVNVGWVLDAHERMIVPALTGLVVQAAQIPLMFWLVHGPEDAIIYVTYPIPLALLGSGFLFWYATRHGLLHPSQLRPTLRGFGELLRESWPLTVSLGAIALYYNCDAVILGFTNGDETVGQYTTAYALLMMPAFIVTALTSAFFPSLARAHDSPDMARRASAEFFRVMVWAGLPLASLGWALGEWVVPLLYGSGYAPAGQIFRWLSLNLALIFFNSSLGQPLYAWGHQKLVLRLTLIAGLSNLFANLIFIPRFGVPAAIVTTLGAEVIISVGLLLARARLHPFAWQLNVLRPLSISVAGAVVMRLMVVNGYVQWWLAGALGCTIMAIGFVVLERQTLRLVLARLRPAPTNAP